MADTIADIGNVQAVLSNLSIVGSNELFTTMGGNVSITPGNYHGTELTIAAGSEIVFNAGGNLDPVWVINLTAALNVGAGTTFRVVYDDENAPPTPTIIWNVGAAITLGAGTEFMGVAFANGAFSAATSKVLCGNIYAKGAVAVGDLNSSNRGDAGCGLRQIPESITGAGEFNYTLSTPRLNDIDCQELDDEAHSIKANADLSGSTSYPLSVSSDWLLGAQYTIEVSGLVGVTVESVLLRSESGEPVLGGGDRRCGIFRR
jgi:hypothetical protein